MPQLDKYIYFNQIVYLTFFFSLIYFYIRRDVIPTVSAILKYRKKKASSLLENIEYYNKLFISAVTILDKKGKIYTIFLLENINTVNIFFQKETIKQLIILQNQLFFDIKSVKQIINFIFKDKIELKRLNYIL